MTTKDELIKLSNETFTTNGEGDIKAVKHRTFNNALIEAMPSNENISTYVVENQTSFESWLNNDMDGSDYSRVFVKPGIYERKNGDLVIPSVTKVVIGAPGAVFDISNPENNLTPGGLRHSKCRFENIVFNFNVWIDPEEVTGNTTGVHVDDAGSFLNCDFNHTMKEYADQIECCLFRGTLSATDKMIFDNCQINFDSTLSNTEYVFPGNFIINGHLIIRNCEFSQSRISSSACYQFRGSGYVEIFDTDFSGSNTDCYDGYIILATARFVFQNSRFEGNFIGSIPVINCSSKLSQGVISNITMKSSYANAHAIAYGNVNPNVAWERINCEGTWKVTNNIFSDGMVDCRTVRNCKVNTYSNSFSGTTNEVAHACANTLNGGWNQKL